jgi:hypothetical protein
VSSAVLIAAAGVAGGAALLSNLSNRFKPCAPPAWQESVLAGYTDDAVLRVASPELTADEHGPYLIRWCDLYGVEHIRPREEVSLSAMLRGTGSWPAAKLRALFEPAARASGWAYVIEGDQEATGCGLPYERPKQHWKGCGPTGVRYCKSVEAMLTYLEITSTPRDLWSTADPNNPTREPAAFVQVQFTAQPELHACPPPSSPRPSPTPAPKLSPQVD